MSDSRIGWPAVAAHQVLAAQRRRLQRTARAPQRGVEAADAGRLGLVGPQGLDELVAREETALRQRQEGQQADGDRPRTVLSTLKLRSLQSTKVR